MNVQATLQTMQKMKLQGMASSYEAMIDLPADKHPESHECVAMLNYKIEPIKELLCLSD